jgi:hypothetical protein
LNRFDETQISITTIGCRSRTSVAGGMLVGGIGKPRPSRNDSEKGESGIA